MTPSFYLTTPFCVYTCLHHLTVGCSHGVVQTCTERVNVFFKCSVCSFFFPALLIQPCYHNIISATLLGCHTWLRAALPAYSVPWAAHVCKQCVCCAGCCSLLLETTQEATQTNMLKHKIPINPQNKDSRVVVTYCHQLWCQTRKVTKAI